MKAIPLFNTYCFGYALGMNYRSAASRWVKVWQNNRNDNMRRNDLSRTTQRIDIASVAPCCRH